MISEETLEEYYKHNASELTDKLSEYLQKQRSVIKTELQKVEITQNWTLTGLSRLNHTLIEEITTEQFEAVALKKNKNGQYFSVTYRFQMVCNPRYDDEGQVNNLIFQLVVPEVENARLNGTFAFSTSQDMDFSTFKFDNERKTSSKIVPNKKVHSFKNAHLVHFIVKNFPDQMTVSVNATVIVQHHYQ